MVLGGACYDGHFGRRWSCDFLSKPPKSFSREAAVILLVGHVQVMHGLSGASGGRCSQMLQLDCMVSFRTGSARTIAVMAHSVSKYIHNIELEFEGRIGEQM